MFFGDTDANNVGIGVLSQVQDGQERVIAYYIKTLNKEERNCCVTWRELLNIIRILEHFDKYLYGQEFHLLTDHSSPLAWVMNFNQSGGSFPCS
jgi:hypothetical protein